MYSVVHHRIDRVLTFSVARTRLDRLGYGLHKRRKDYLGRTWPYVSYPRGSGPVNYFATLEDVTRYIEQVEWTRAAGIS